MAKLEYYERTLETNDFNQAVTWFSQNLHVSVPTNDIVSLELQYTDDKDTYVARFWTCGGVFLDVGTLSAKENVRKMDNFPKFDVDFEHDIIVVHRPAVARALKAFKRLSL